MKQINLIIILSLYSLLTSAQCNTKTNHRPDGITIKYFKPKPVMRSSQYEVGVGIYKKP